MIPTLVFWGSAALVAIVGGPRWCVAWLAVTGSMVALFWRESRGE